MAVNFALFLSSEGIALAHRQVAGHWAIIGETQIDVDDLDHALQNLHAKGVARGGDGFHTVLILPDDQILYTTVAVPTDDMDATIATIKANLDGFTPYPVDALKFDFRPIGPSQVKLAVVAQDTLDEARAFAEGHKFNSVGFMAMPPADQFPGLPIFTIKGAALDLGLDPTGMAFGPDEWVAPASMGAMPPNNTIQSAMAGSRSTHAAEMPGQSAPLVDRAAHSLSAPDPDTAQTAQSRRAKAEETVTPDEKEAPLPPLTFSARVVKVPKAQAQLDPAIHARPSRFELSAPQAHKDTQRPAFKSTENVVSGASAGHQDAATTIAPSQSGAAGWLTRLSGIVPSLGAVFAWLTAKTSSAFAWLNPMSRHADHRIEANQPTKKIVEKPKTQWTIGAMFPALSQGAWHVRDRAFQKRAPARQIQSPAATNSDAVLTSGLLARDRARQKSGPSFRTGLVLTGVLFGLLAAVAIWAVFFLPENPATDTFESENRASLNNDLSPPPDSVVAPPLIGEIDQNQTPERSDEDEVVLAPLPDIGATTPSVTPEDQVSIQPLQPTESNEAVDVPPLPPLPLENVPTVEEAEQFYAEDNIWIRTPNRPDPNVFDSESGVDVAVVDPNPPETVAIELPVPPLNGTEAPSDDPLDNLGNAVSGQVFALVDPTPEGVLTPQGAFVVAGRPPVVAIPRPGAAIVSDDPVLSATDITQPPPEEDVALPSINVEDALLGLFRPQPRPAQDATQDDVRRIDERVVPTIQIAAFVPTPRPITLNRPDATNTGQGVESLSETTEDRNTNEFSDVPNEAVQTGLVASLIPNARPRELAAAPASSRAPEPVAAPALTTQPTIPSNTSVARAATERNTIRLRNVNLIGVTGTPADRRAMVRLPSGRFIRVGVGDRLDGGRVAAIGEASLQYVRNGRNITLEIPG